MKDIKKMKKDFIKLCETKRKSKKANIQDISKKMHIEKGSLEKFFKGENNLTLNTILKILSYLDSDLKIK